MKGIEIRDFMGDYALDIPMGDRSVHTIYFNSRRNAEMVKRIMEVDDSVPNAATVCDVVEVVHGRWIFEHDPIKDPKKYFVRIVCSCCGLKTGQVSNFCPKCGAKMDERKEQT